jgi:solute carrier family 13 (sodium-dependent dicarboxylate transporter), member 2/3/5
MDPGEGVRRAVRRVGVVAGPALAVAVYVLLPDTYVDPSGREVAFTQAGRATAAVAAWMATWWLTEAIDVPATALLPIAVLPLMGAATIGEATAPYAQDLIYLFIGGFVLALSLQRWGLDRRIALLTLRFVGTRPRHVVGGFMVATAVMSMWVSNTATVAMMLPIALSVVNLARRAHPSEDPEEGSPLALALLLGIAYAASVGGLGTVIGSPPNLLVASYINEQLGGDVSFVRWLMVGLPLVAVLLPITWFLVTRRLEREPLDDGGSMLRDAYEALGRPSAGEWATFVVFSVTALAWVFRPVLNDLRIGGAAPFAGLTDPGIAILAAVALFLIPVGHKERAMNWETARGLPWGTLVLFGGGLSLAAAIERNGVGDYLGSHVQGLAEVPGPIVVLAVVAGVVFLTELTSNTATTATLVPILAGVAPALSLDPYLLIVPAALAASLAFMMPVATPPNALVFGTGHVTVPQMARAGLRLNLIGIGAVMAAAYLLVVPLLAPVP